MEFSERAVLPTVTYGRETLGVRIDERHKPHFMATNCLRSMSGVTREDSWKNEEVRRRIGVREK